VLGYVEKGTVVADLLRAQMLHCGPDQRLLTEWVSDARAPELFKMLAVKGGKRDQGDAFVRWRVQVPGDPVSAVWEYPSVRDSWIRFDTSPDQKRGFCMVTGETTAARRQNHLRFVFRNRRQSYGCCPALLLTHTALQNEGVFGNPRESRRGIL
jgi:CRISPR-associated protein Csd1